MTNQSYNPLTAEEKYIIEHKGTERPFTGEYDDFSSPAFPCAIRKSAVDHQTAMTRPPTTRRTNPRLRNGISSNQRSEMAMATATVQPPAIIEEKRDRWGDLNRNANCMAPVFSLRRLSN